MYGVLHANLALLTRPEEVHPAQRPLGLFLQSKDVMGKNVAIYQGQASAKRQLAKKDVKIVVVANPSRLPPSRRRSIPPKGPLASSCSPEAQRAAAAQTNPQQMGRGAGMGGNQSKPPVKVLVTGASRRRGGAPGGAWRPHNPAPRGPAPPRAPTPAPACRPRRRRRPGGGRRDP